MLPRANSAWAKQVNRAHILSLLFYEGPLSRQAIAERTGLTSGAVSSITKEMVAQGLIQEIGEDQTAPPRVGRRSILIDLVPNYGYALGMEIVSERIVLVCSNLKAEVIHKKELPYDPTSDAEAGLTQVSRLLEEFIAELGVERNRLVGLGVGVPGIIDNVAGVVLSALHFGWKDTPICKILSSRLGFPVVLDNNVKMMGFGESILRSEKEDLVLFTYVGQGIGGVILSNGEIIRGIANAAGEIGHTLIDSSGSLCSCGMRGCLESFVANPRIVEQARKVFEGRGFADPEEITIDTVVEAAKAGDPDCRAILKDAAHQLGLGLSNAVNTLNPTLLVVTGKLMNAGDFIREAIKESTEARCVHITNNGMEIECKPYDPYLSAFGGAARVLHTLFYTPPTP